MKLLFDQNVSPRLVTLIADLFPGSSHVSLLGLERATDMEVWAYARTNDYFIVTKDADFADLAVIHGFPPRIIWVRLGNCSTQQIEQALRRNHPTILNMGMDPASGS